MNNSPLNESEHQKTDDIRSDPYAPFAAPKLATNSSAFLNASPEVSDAIIFEIKMSEDFLVESYLSYSRGATGSFIFSVVVWIVSFLLGVVILLILTVGLATQGRVPIATFFLVVAFFYLVFRRQISIWRVRRLCRSRPDRNREYKVALDETGFHATSIAEETRSSWDSFSESLLFSDGVMLFRGPQMFHWLPDRSLRKGTYEDVERLVRRKVPKIRIISKRNP